MKELKNMKGITLVSLVITIIVLIILAAVSINLTIGTDGIITRAKEAAENMEIAALEEQVRLNELYEQLDSGAVGGGTSYDKIAELKTKYDQLNAKYTDFKTQIAQAITNKGVETSSTDSEETMVANIGNISGNSALKDLSFEVAGYSTSSDFTYTIPNDGTYLVFVFLHRDHYTTSASLSVKYNNSEYGNNIEPYISASAYGYLRIFTIDANTNDTVKVSASYNTNGRVWTYILKVDPKDTGINLNNYTLSLENYTQASNPIKTQNGNKLIITFYHMDHYTSYFGHTLARNNITQGSQMFVQNSYLINIALLEDLTEDDVITSYFYLGTNGRPYSFSFNLN